MTAHDPENARHRKPFLTKKTSRAGGASGEPRQAGKTQITRHPGHGILTETDRETGYPGAGPKRSGRGKTAFPHSRAGGTGLI